MVSILEASSEYSAVFAVKTDSGDWLSCEALAESCFETAGSSGMGFSGCEVSVSGIGLWAVVR